MNKTKGWYRGRGIKGRASFEAKLAGKYNPQCETVTCQGCGTDTINSDMLCERCKQNE